MARLRLKLVLQSSVVSAGLTLYPTAALAQSTATPPAQSQRTQGQADGTAPQQSSNAQTAPDAGDIVVTARRRNESLLNTPVSITAFGSAAIAARGLQNLDQVSSFTPSFDLTRGSGGNSSRALQTLSIRGMTPVFQTSPTVSVFIDGAPYTAGLVEGIDDLERVEILKGPQSATFGRQAFAGAINLVTKVPSDHLRLNFRGLLSTSETDDRASIEGPILGDALTGRVSLRYYNRQGDYRNTAPQGGRLGDENTISASIALSARLSDRLHLTLYGSARRDDDGPSATGDFSVPDFNCNAGAAPAGQVNYFCGTLPNFSASPFAQNTVVDNLVRTALIAGNASGRTNNLYSDSLGLDHGGLRQYVYHAHLTVDYDINSKVRLSSLTAFNLRQDARLFDYDLRDTSGVPNPSYGVLPYTEPYINWLYDFQDRNIDYSTELRLSSQGENRFRWSIGANYVYSRLQISASGLRPTGPSNDQNGNPSDAKTTSAFFSAAYDIGPLTANAEGRYQIDDISVLLRPMGAGNDTTQAEKKYYNFSPRLTLQYHLTPNVQAYASYAVGINPAVFNINLLSLPAAQLQFIQDTYGIGLEVKPEKLKNYEIGVKGQFFHKMLSLELAAYTARWIDQLQLQGLTIPLFVNGQPTSGTSFQFLNSNAGRTNLKGIELEGSLRPMAGLSVEFTGSINDSKVVRLACTNCTALTGRTDFSGNQLPNTSKYSASVGLDYSHKLDSLFDGYVHVDYAYKSGRYETVANLAKTQDINLVNLRGGIRNDRYGVELFVNNLTNNRTPIGLDNNFDLLSPGFSQKVIQFTLPNLREFGLRLTLSL